MILLTLYILLILIAIIVPKSKFVAILLFVFSFLLMALNTENPDSEGYMDEYELAKNDFSQLLKLEIGHYYLMKICNQIGMSFYQYKIVVSAIVYILLYSSITRVSKYPSFIAAVYLLICLPTDVIQYRNILAFSIVFWGVTKLLLKDETKNILLYLLMVIIATSFHFSSIFYALLVFARRGYSMKFFVVLAVLSIVISFSFFDLFQAYIDITLKNISGYEDKVNPIAVVLYSVVYVLSCLYLYMINRKRIIALGLLDSKFIFLSNVLLLLLLPFFVYDTNFNRLIKFWHIPTIIFLSNMYLLQKNLVRIIPILLYVLFWLLTFTSGTVKIYEPVLNNNLLVQ